MGTAAAARIISTALRLLLQRQDEEKRSSRLIIGISAAVFIFLLLMYVALQILVMPFGFLTGMFLPKSVRELKQSMEESFERPFIDTEKDSILSWPVTDTCISSGYGYRYIPGRPDLSDHEGYDFSVAFGTSVAAAAPGVVEETGVSAAYGSYIMIRHEMERWDSDDEWIDTEVFYSLYAHLSRVYVLEGWDVEEGRQIALSGGDPALHFAGNTTGPHLHFELRSSPEYGSDFDPYDYLRDRNAAMKGAEERETRYIEWL